MKAARQFCLVYGELTKKIIKTETIPPVPESPELPTPDSRYDIRAYSSTITWNPVPVFN
jgi:hypothetical protein